MWKIEFIRINYWQNERLNLYNCKNNIVFCHFLDFIVVNKPCILYKFPLRLHLELSNIL